MSLWSSTLQVLGFYIAYSSGFLTGDLPAIQHFGGLSAFDISDLLDSPSPNRLTEMHNTAIQLGLKVKGER